MKRHFISTALLILAVSVAATAAPGDLDTTFSGDGKVVYENGFSEGAVNVGVMPNGDIAVLTPHGVYILDDDGEPILRSFGFTGDSHTAMAIQPDGKIVTVGNRYNPNNPFCALHEVNVRRFNTDGTPDTSFASDGSTWYTAGCYNEGYTAKGHAVALQPDGKIVVAGESSTDYDYDFLAIRLTSSGLYDTSFSQDGIALLGIGDYPGCDQPSTALAVAVNPTNGRIALAGGVVIGWCGAATPALAMVVLNTNGGYDRGFGYRGSGVVIDSMGWGCSPLEFQTVSFQSDGKIVASGAACGGGLVARYTAGGALDTTFSGDGLFLIEPEEPGDGPPSVERVFIQPDGKIVGVASGIRYGFSYFRPTVFAVFRLEEEGVFDTTFGNAGKKYTTFGVAGASPASMALQSDGKIVVAGRTTVDGDYDVALARYLP